MTKQELAIRYFPQWKKPRDRRKATKKLYRWICCCPELMQKLAATGYRVNNRDLTPTQVALIVDYLGEP